MCVNNYYVLSALLCSAIPVINGQELFNSPQCSSRGAKTLKVSIKYCQRSWNGAARASSNATPSQCWSLKSHVTPWHGCTTHCWAPREPFRLSHLVQVQVGLLLGWHLGDMVTLHPALCPIGVPNTHLCACCHGVPGGQHFPPGSINRIISSWFLLPTGPPTIMKEQGGWGVGVTQT